MMRKGLWFGSNIFFLLLVVASVLFIPVASCSAIYDSARASCEGNIFDALRQVYINKNGIDFYIRGEDARIVLTFLAVIGAVMFGAFRKGAVLSIVLYIAALLLLAECVFIVEQSVLHAGEGMTGYTGYSWFVFADIAVFALVFTLQRLLLRRSAKQ